MYSRSTTITFADTASSDCLIRAFTAATFRSSSARARSASRLAFSVCCVSPSARSTTPVSSSASTTISLSSLPAPIALNTSTARFSERTTRRWMNTDIASAASTAARAMPSDSQTLSLIAVACRRECSSSIGAAVSNSS